MTIIISAIIAVILKLIAMGKDKFIYDEKTSKGVKVKMKPDKAKPKK